MACVARTTCVVHVTVVVFIVCRASGERGCGACDVGCVPSGVACLVLVVCGTHIATFLLSECEGRGDFVVSDARGEGGAGVEGSSLAVCGVHLSCAACVVWGTCVAHVTVVVSEGRLSWGVRSVCVARVAYV